MSMKRLLVLNVLKAVIKARNFQVLNTLKLVEMTHRVLKDTRHTLPKINSVTFVPKNSTKVIQIKEKYKSNNLAPDPTMSPKTSKTQNPNPSPSQSQSSNESEISSKCIGQTSIQTTLLDLTAPQSQTTDGSLDDVMAAIKDLTLEVKNLQSHHKEICNITFNDHEKSKIS